MQILQTILAVIFFISCAVLMFLILIQSGKGGSLGIMGGGGSSSPFGSSTVDVVEKATWYGIAAFISLAVISAIAFADSGPKLNLPASDTPHAEESAAPPAQPTPTPAAKPVQPQGQAAPTTPVPTKPAQ